jgi:hypothetical protein
MLRWRPRPPCLIGCDLVKPTIVHLQGPRNGPRTPPTESTPRVRLSGAASPLDLFEQPAELLKKAHMLRWRPRPPCLIGCDLVRPTIVHLRGPRNGPRTPPTESTPRVRLTGAASHLDLFEQPAEMLKKADVPRWRPRPPCLIGCDLVRPTIVHLRGPRNGPRTPPTESTPRVRFAGAASPLDVL